ncbi:hypothetical protein GJ496_001003 [Pomphorhynchus laevis]|nr:hypothetical protein GJ496_001003 [Pomphorhynchus laevis]
MTAIFNEEVQTLNTNMEMDFPQSFNINEYNEDDDGTRISISVLLPEQFARRLNLSVNTRTPVLDLIVYLSSLFRFNPSDYVLGYVDNEDKKGFRVLMPNSSIGSTGSSVLQLAQKKQVMITFFEDGGCLRHAYCTKGNDHFQNRSDVSQARRLVNLSVILPDGQNSVMNEPEDWTLGQLFHLICKQYNLDQNCFTLQLVEHSNLNSKQILTSNTPLSTIKNSTLQMISTLKSCNLAESESSVDRMNKRYMMNQFNQIKIPPKPVLANSAVKALVAGTMMSDVTEGLGLNCKSNGDINEQKPSNESEHAQKLCTTFDRMHGLASQTVELANINLQHIQSCFPQGQNTLDIQFIKSNKKQRAPLPPALNNRNSQQREIRYFYRNGRVHSASSTMDDISEDFRQAIQMGSTTTHVCDKFTQTSELAKPKFSLTNQQIQTTPELLTQEDIDISELLKPNVVSTEFHSISSNKIAKESANNETPTRLPYITSIIKQNDLKSAVNIPIKSQSGFFTNGKRVVTPVNPIFIRKTNNAPPMNTVSTQSDGIQCKICTHNEQQKLAVQKKKGFLSKIQLNKTNLQPDKNLKNIINIITDQDRLYREMLKRKIKPIELEVTEKTTTVECTVTVTSEGKSVSALSRPLPSTSNESALGPRPYVKNAEYRKLTSFDNSTHKDIQD